MLLRTSEAFVKKKAALTLLRLYRKYPGIVQQEWGERIISMMDDPDLGVALSVTSLVMALVQDNAEQYKGSYVKAAHRLKKIVVDNEYAPGYLYYKVPCPWIQVKFLRLLQYYPPSGKPFFWTGFHLDMADWSRGHPCAQSDKTVTSEDPGCGNGYAKKCTTKQCPECRLV